MKRSLLLLSLILVSSLTFGQSKSGLFTPARLEINSENGVFAKGDTVKIYGSLVEPFEGEIQMKIYINGSTRHYGTFKLKPEVRTLNLTEEKSLIYCEVFYKPTTVMLSVAPKGEKKLSSMIGFGVAPEELRPGYDMPADFVKYWDGQKKALRKSKMKIIKEPLEIKDAKDAERFDAFSVELSMPEGNPARGYLVMPKNAEKKSLPILLLVHSAGVSRPGCASNLSACIKNAKLREGGAIVFDLNAHGMLNGQPKEYYKELEQGELKGYQSRPLTTRKEMYFHNMYLREVRTMDFLCSLPEWNQKVAVVMGGSQGGGQSLAIAGLDSRITACCATVPAMTDYGASLQGRQCGWPSGYAKDADTELGRDILPYVDGAQFIQLTKARMFMVAGWIDVTCHAGCVHAAYNVCTSPDKQIHDFPYRWHSGSTPPFDKVWDATIGKAKDKFLKESLQ